MGCCMQRVKSNVGQIVFHDELEVQCAHIKWENSITVLHLSLSLILILNVNVNGNVDVNVNVTCFLHLQAIVGGASICGLVGLRVRVRVGGESNYTASTLQMYTGRCGLQCTCSVSSQLVDDRQIQQV